MRYSLEPSDRINVEEYGFMYLEIIKRNILCNNIIKNGISKNR